MIMHKTWYPDAPDEFQPPPPPVPPEYDVPAPPDPDVPFPIIPPEAPPPVWRPIPSFPFLPELSFPTDEGVTVRPYYDELYGGPKGFTMYVTGKLENNGTIDNSHGAKAEGQDVYLWKNADGTYVRFHRFLFFLNFHFLPTNLLLLLLLAHIHMFHLHSSTSTHLVLRLIMI